MEIYKPEAEELGIELIKIKRFGKIKKLFHAFRDGEVWFKWNGKTYRTEGYFFNTDYIYNVAIKAVKELIDKQSMEKLFASLGDKE